MRLDTRHFGEIDVNKDGIIDFQDGLLGFEHVKKYVVIKNPDPENPFMWLQAIDQPELAFVIVNPFIITSDYDFNIPDNIIEALEIEKQEDVFVYSIAVLPENIKDMTINLTAPLIINFNSRKGKQVVLDSDRYSLKHKVFVSNEKAG